MAVKKVSNKSWRGKKDTHFCHSTNFPFSLQRKRSSISETKTGRMRL